MSNEYQGSLRFAWLDIDLLATTIHNDLENNNTGISVEHGLAVTCLDQVDDNHIFIRNKIQHKTHESELLKVLKKATRANFMLTSHGPSRNHVG